LHGASGGCVVPQTAVRAVVRREREVGLRGLPCSGLDFFYFFKQALLSFGLNIRQTSSGVFTFLCRVPDPAPDKRLLSVRLLTLGKPLFAEYTVAESASPNATLSKAPFAEYVVAKWASPSVTLGKAFAECFEHSTTSGFPLVSAINISSKRLV
jgi:hypothetical protein